jgi:hypothetical protein
LCNYKNNFIIRRQWYDHLPNTTTPREGGKGKELKGRRKREGVKGRRKREGVKGRRKREGEKRKEQKGRRERTTCLSIHIRKENDC